MPCKVLLVFVCLLLSSEFSRATAVTIIENPGIYTRIIAVSDIHGMYKALQKLLIANRIIDEKGAWVAGKTLLVVVGDSIDKGPDSVEVIDQWMGLMPAAEKAGGKLLVMLGNHEAEFLANPFKDKKAISLYANLKRNGLRVDDLLNAKSPRGAFLRTLPIAAKIGNWFFSHAGLYPSRLNFDEFSAKQSRLLSEGLYKSPLITGENSVLEDKTWWRKGSSRRANLEVLSKNGFYGVVFGHQPGAFKVKGKIASAMRGRAIKIDSGMPPQSGEYPGQMLEFAQPAQLSENIAPVIYALDNSGRRLPVIASDE